MGSIGNLAFYQVGKRAGSNASTTIMGAGFLSGLPVLGSWLTTAAGAFGVPRPALLLRVTIGAMLRNWLWAILFVGTYKHYRG